MTSSTYRNVTRPQAGESEINHPKRRLSETLLGETRRNQLRSALEIAEFTHSVDVESKRMKMTSVSIALATYNGEAHLKEQLDSIAAQTELPDELVVCDDLSDDDTLDILQNFQRHAAFPVRLFLNTERLGYGDNFSKAASHCSSNWIAFCDQDDYWLSSKLERIKELISNTAVSVIQHNLIYVNKDLEPFPEIRSSVRIGSKPLFLRQFVNGCSLTVRSDFAKRALALKPAGAPHDTWLNSCALTLDTKINIPDVLICYRRHGENFGSNLPVEGGGNGTLSISQFVKSILKDSGQILSEWPAISTRKLQILVTALALEEYAKSTQLVARLKVEKDLYEKRLTIHSVPLRMAFIRVWRIRSELRCFYRPRFLLVDIISILLRSILGKFSQFSTWRDAGKC